MGGIGITYFLRQHFLNDMANILVVDDELGIRDLVLFPTALFGVHKKLIPHIKSGVIRRIMGSVNGPIGQLVSEGGMADPVVLRSHGGRPRAVTSGDVHIDVAFVAAPTADRYGNLSGVGSVSSCGSLGYAFTDAQYADCVVAVTDHLRPYPIAPISIPQYLVDYVVEDDGIGIAPEHIPRLTERFYRVDRGRSRETGGTGLGLAIVKHVLSRHQGDLLIESEPGHGSRFTASFPMGRAIGGPGKSERTE